MTGIVTLCSSSEGNSSLVINGERLALIDAGASAKTILERVKELGFDPKNIEGLFITHEHSDHCKGLCVLRKRLPDIPVFASAGTAKALGLADARLVATGECVSCAGLDFVSFATPHDAAESFGYVVSEDGEKRIGYCTDIGYVTSEIRESLSGCKIVVLESNYDENMLMLGSYPYELKRRIKSKKGHLSNEECDLFISELSKSGTEKIILAHLSCENNMPELALEGARVAAQSNVNICVAPRKEPSEAYYA